jgi:hypothetical protein
VRHDVIHMHERGQLVLKYAIGKVPRRQMRLFHAVYVNGKISAVAECKIPDLIAGFIYYVYIFST